MFFVFFCICLFLLLSTLHLFLYDVIVSIALLIYIIETIGVSAGEYGLKQLLYSAAKKCFWSLYDVVAIPTRNSVQVFEASKLEVFLVELEDTLFNGEIPVACGLISSGSEEIEEIEEISGDGGSIVGIGGDISGVEVIVTAEEIEEIEEISGDGVVSVGIGEQFGLKLRTNKRRKAVVKMMKAAKKFKKLFVMRTNKIHASSQLCLTNTAITKEIDESRLRGCFACFPFSINKKEKNSVPDIKASSHPSSVPSLSLFKQNSQMSSATNLNTAHSDLVSDSVGWATFDSTSNHQDFVAAAERSGIQTSASDFSSAQGAFALISNSQHENLPCSPALAVAPSNKEWRPFDDIGKQGSSEHPFADKCSSAGHSVGSIEPVDFSKGTSSGHFPCLTAPSQGLGGISYMTAKAPNSQLQNVQTHGSAASIGGNPFA